MFGIIFNFIVAIIIFIAMGFSYKFVKADRYSDPTVDVKWKGLNKKQFLAIIPLVFIFFSMLQNIPANRVGIAFDPLQGGVQEDTYGEGLHVVMPWVSIMKLDTEVTGLEFTELSVQTADSQWVSTTLQVQLAIDSSMASDYFRKHRDKELEDIQGVIRSTIQRELEAVTTKTNVMDLLGDKRSEVVLQATERLRAEFEKDGIRFDRLILVDTDAGQAIEAAIAKEAAAKKEAEAAVHQKKKAQEEGEAAKIKAELEADAAIAKANGEAEALRLVAEALESNPALIELETIKKWNGVLPQVTGGNGMIFDIGGLK